MPVPIFADPLALDPPEDDDPLDAAKAGAAANISAEAAKAR